MSRKLQCSFCQKSESEVQKLVAGPAVFICDECVTIAARIMAEADAGPAASSNWRRLLDRGRSAFGLAPRRLRQSA